MDQSVYMCAEMAAKKIPQTVDIFVGNLPSESNERNIGKLFTKFGEIANITVKESSKVKGPYNKFAFVRFLCEQDADRAIAEMNRMKLEGSEIVVKRSEDRRGGRAQGDGMKKIIKTSDTDSMDSGSGGVSMAAYQPNQPGMLPATGMDGENGGNRGLTYYPTGDQKEIVLITHVESPITLWQQSVSEENTNKIFSITEQLATVCPASSPISGQPEPGKMYACLFTEDNMWYRCQVKQSFGADKYKIQYVDYGNVEEISAQSLVELPPSLASMKGLATKILLHNTRAKDLSDKQGIEYLKTLTNNQMAHLQRTNPLADGTGWYGNMWVNDTSLGESMLHAGFCSMNPKMSMKKPQMNAGKMNQMGPLCRGGVGPPGTDGFQDSGIGPPGPQMMGQGMFQGPGGHGKKGPQRDQRNTVSPYGGPPPLMGPPQHGMGPPPPMMNQHMPNMGFPAKITPIQNQGQDKKLQAELNKKRQENERLKNEKDAAKMELDYMRSKVKTLQEEFAVSAAKLQEDTLSKRIITVVSLAGVVRKLREQFPTSGKTCLLEDAIKLTSDDNRVDNSKCRSLTEVGSALSCYKAAQDEVSKCKEQVELQELIQARDESRRQLHKKLCICLEEMDRMPLEPRSKQVEELQARLVNTYNDYLKIQIQDCPNMENMLPGFNTWKAKKDSEFSDVRMATDFCEEAMQTALAQVKERISIQGDVNVDKPDVDMDDLMKTYAHALQREINITDMVHSKDANFVTTVIASVRKELQSEASMLENFTILRQEFVNRKESIEPWLDQTPTLSDMQENRKTIRSLRSKLRHLQADKLDLEESGSEGELDTVKEEEGKIRSQLQETLVKSETFINEVASLANSNFPELLVQYPDLGIDSYLMYKGLVKANRDIDHYQLKSSFRPGVHESMFNGEKVLIQEFHINDSEHCSKDDFMKQVVKYNGDTNTIQAVFFNKSERQAYIQSAREDCDLAEVVCKSREFNPHDLQQMALSLVQQVVTVHARGCVHGEITPQSVLIKGNNTVMLMYPDFSKLPSERISKRCVTDSGIVFQSPELQFSTPDALGTAVDIYNMVLFIFWLHYPNGKPSSVSSGQLASQTKKLSPSLQMLFDGVLSGKSCTRATAEQVLQLDYFTKPLPEQQVVSPATSPAPCEPVTVATMTPQQQAPVIKSTDEPMEIGVFRAEDYMTEPALLPPGQPIVSGSSGDTDNSWTTESSMSATNSSRGDSPLDTVLEVPKSESQNTVIGEIGEVLDHAEAVVSDTVNTDSGNVEISGNSLDNVVTPTETETSLAEQSSQCDNDINGSQSEMIETPDVSPQTTNSEAENIVFVETIEIQTAVEEGVQVETENVDESEEGSPPVPLPTAKGAACEDIVKEESGNC